jgi:DNA polymerase-3 subunit delta'
VKLTHPDLHWIFPRERLKDADDLEDVAEDYAEAIAERAGDSGLYAPPSGMQGIFIAAVRLLVQRAGMSPAIARRKVFVIGDAERMVSQEGSEQAANAFLKLLEEPPSDTTLILTTSEPGALLPTVRSRAISVMVPPLGDDEVRGFLADPHVEEKLSEEDELPAGVHDRVRLAGGAPGRLLAASTWALARKTAESLLAAAGAGPVERYAAAWSQAGFKARGAFSETLDALTDLLHERARRSVEAGTPSGALAATRAIEVVEQAKERVASNVNPQLITVNLVAELRNLFA